MATSNVNIFFSDGKSWKYNPNSFFQLPHRRLYGICTVHDEHKGNDESYTDS